MRGAWAAPFVLPCFAPSALTATAAVPEAGTVIARSHRVAQRLPAYGQVVPIALVPVRAAETGVVADMRVVPGSRVRTGERLAALVGPQIQSLLVDREGALRSARSRMAAAGAVLAIERRQLTVQQSTEQSVAVARSVLAAARAAFHTARAQMQVARQMSTLRAPSSGTVIAVNAGEGERVVAGQTVLTLEASKRLWLTANYYGADALAIRIGMTGTFQPAEGGAPVPVKVAAVASALGADGGEAVGLLAYDPHTGGIERRAPWMSGEWGNVMLQGPATFMVAVPTRALIIDRGNWWVLVRTPRGDRRQEVSPGPTSGWMTLISRGLKPDEQVVVQNAYLEFHRGISQRYTPPD
jgi:membrane fusion protein, heavy metal efflux system